MKIILDDGQLKFLVQAKLDAGMLPQLKKFCTDAMNGSRRDTASYLEGAAAIAGMMPPDNPDVVVIHLERNVFFFSLQHKTLEQWTLELEKLQIKTARTVMVKMVADRVNVVRKSLPYYKQRFPENRLNHAKLSSQSLQTTVGDGPAFSSYELPAITTRAIAREHYQTMEDTIGAYCFRKDLLSLKVILTRDEIDDSVWAEAWGLVVCGEIIES